MTHEYGQAELLTAWLEAIRPAATPEANRRYAALSAGFGVDFGKQLDSAHPSPWRDRVLDDCRRAALRRHGYEPED
jgi:hypothetical protein